MNQIIEFIDKNKEWIFSGIGVLVVGGIGKFLFSQKEKSDVQKAKSGRNSTIIQTKGDVKYTNQGNRNE